MFEGAQAKQITKELRNAFKESWRSYGFSADSAWAWRVLEEMQQCVYLDRGTVFNELQLGVVLRFRKPGEVFDRPRFGFSSHVGLLIEALNTRRQSELHDALSLEHAASLTWRIAVLREWCGQVILPWLEMHRTLKSITNQIDPSTGHLSRPLVAGRSFYEFIGRFPRVWPLAP